MPLPFIGFFLLAQVGALRVTDHTEINGLMMVFTGISIVLASRKNGIYSSVAVQQAS